MIRLVERGQLTAIASLALAEELIETLSRPKFHHEKFYRRDIDALLKLLGPLIPDIELVAPIRDTKDLPVIRTAIAGEVPTIITGDKDFLDDPEIQFWLDSHDIEVLSASEALRRLG